MNREVNPKISLPEFDQYSYKGEIKPYGCDRADDVDIIPEDRGVRVDDKSTYFTKE